MGMRLGERESECLGLRSDLGRSLVRELSPALQMPRHRTARTLAFNALIFPLPSPRGISDRWVCLAGWEMHTQVKPGEDSGRIDSKNDSDLTSSSVFVYLVSTLRKKLLMGSS